MVVSFLSSPGLLGYPQKGECVLMNIGGTVLVDSPDLAGAMLVWVTKEHRPWLGGRYVAANWDVGQLEEKKEEIIEKDLFKMRVEF